MRINSTLRKEGKKEGGKEGRREGRREKQGTNLGVFDDDSIGINMFRLVSENVGHRCHVL
jgi:hypothetical protein